MTSTLLLSVLLFLLAVGSVHLTAADDAPRRYDLYLLIGQSNMAGRGPVDAESAHVHPRVFALSKAGVWESARDPLHFDKPEAAVGPGFAFGQAIAAADAQANIGLIPCAVGGSAIAEWTPGGQEKYTKAFPYDDALRRTRLAQRSGTLKGIIWHQGEADRGLPQRTLYGERLAQLVARLRSELQAPEVPFLAGELPMLDERSRNSTTEFNRILASLTDKIPLFTCVPANNLTDKGDHLHLDTASAREFGQRYATAFLKLRQNR